MAAQLMALKRPRRPLKRWISRGDDLLAGAALAEQEDDELGRRDALDVGGDVVHLEPADELGSRARRVGCAMQGAVDAVLAYFSAPSSTNLKHRVADADLVERLELDLAHRMAVDHRAVAAAEIAHDEPGALLRDLRVAARNGRHRQHDVGRTVASDDGGPARERKGRRKGRVFAGIEQDQTRRAAQTIAPPRLERLHLVRALFRHRSVADNLSTITPRLSPKARFSG